MNPTIRKSSIKLLSLIFLVFLTGCMSTSNTTHYKSIIPAENLPEKGEYLEFMISVNIGGGLDKFTRFIIGVIVQGSYYDMPVLPANKTGGPLIAMHVLLREGVYENTITIGSNSFITTALFQNLPFSYRDLTPVSILALKDYIIWVEADSPWNTAREFIAEARERNIPVGGTGSKQSDEFVFRLMEQASGTKPFEYMPMRYVRVAEALADGEVKATVNQVNEIIEHYPERVKPLCVFRDENLELPDGQVVPSCRDAGIDATYNDFIAIFAPSGISAEHKAKLVRLFEDVSRDESWIAYAEYMGWRPYFLKGDEMETYLADMDKLHVDLFIEQGWIQRKSTEIE